MKLGLKKVFIPALSVAVLCIFMSASTSAQLRLPRPSQGASVMQTVGTTDITITYSRPLVKGRKIFGDPPADSYAKGESTLDDQNKRPDGMVIVPYGHVWRTGANEATQFVVTDDVLINGKPLPAGSYSLHTIPGQKEWTIVFNGQANQWGSFSYDPSKDTLRVTAVPASTSDMQEAMLFTLDPATPSSAVANIRWDKVRVPFTIEVKDVSGLALQKARSVVSGAAADNWQIPLTAAMYARDNNTPSDAKMWFDQALKAIDSNIAKLRPSKICRRRRTFSFRPKGCPRL